MPKLTYKIKLVKEVETVIEVESDIQLSELDLALCAMERVSPTTAWTDRNPVGVDSVAGPWF